MRLVAFSLYSSIKHISKTFRVCTRVCACVWWGLVGGWGGVCVCVCVCVGGGGGGGGREKIPITSS